MSVSGNGQGATPYAPAVVRSADVGNTLEQHADGLFVGNQAPSPVVVTDTPSVDLTGDGTPGNPVTAALRFSGATVIWPSSVAPAWGLLCQGQAVSRTTYANLFAAIGTVWGSGNGTTTFNLPDLRGVLPLGASATHALATSGGEETHTLVEAEMAAHRHAHPDYPNGFVSSNGGVHVPNSGSSLVDGLGQSQFTAFNGGDQPHNNMPPYRAVNFVIVI